MYSTFYSVETRFKIGAGYIGMYADKETALRVMSEIDDFKHPKAAYPVIHNIKHRRYVPHVTTSKKS